MKISYVLLSVLLWNNSSCFSEATTQGKKSQDSYSKHIKREYIAKQTKEKIQDLCRLSRLGYIETVKNIVKDHILADPPKGGIRIDINASDDPEEGCALIQACEEAQIEVVDYLLKVPNISLNITKEDGTTPLIAACECTEEDDEDITIKRQARVAIVKNILEAAKSRKIQLDLNASLNTPVKGLEGYFTALMLARANGFVEIVDLLLQEGAARDVYDREEALAIAKTDGD